MFLSSERIRQIRGFFLFRANVGVTMRFMKIESARDLIVYKKAYGLAMRVFEASKKFPVEEKYALTGQSRRASRSVCLNLREAWAKRRYEALISPNARPHSPSVA